MVSRAIGVKFDAAEMLVGVEVLHYPVKVALGVPTFFVRQDGVDILDARAAAAFFKLPENELLDGRRLPQVLDQPAKKRQLAHRVLLPARQLVWLRGLIGGPPPPSLR
jgi:hypothetical protein